MDRLNGLSRALTFSKASHVAEVQVKDAKQSTNLEPYPARTENSAPHVAGDYERLKIIRKKYQSLEDTERCMTEWKSKGELNLVHLHQFILGEIAAYGQKYLDFIKSDPDFQSTEHQVLKESQRRMCNILLFKLIRKFPVSLTDYKKKPWDLTSLFVLSSLTQRSLSTKVAVHFFLYGKSILTLGTEKHMKYVENALTLRDLGCFALTELTHGSNVQGCLTNAVFDEKKKDFVIYTPHERGVKFWIGNAAQTANMAVVAANLIVKGRDYGIHMFLVEIRDRTTHQVLPGITIGDCGDKMGLNGVDNGFLAFRGLRVPLDSLLNRITNVDEEGNVTSKFTNKNQRFAVQMSALSDGRVKISMSACMQGIKSVCIALRFATVRRQFGKEDFKELPIIEYPSMRNRLFPLLARSIVPIFAVRKINNLWYDNYKKILDLDNQELKEIHALVSVMKPLTTAWAVSSFGECRQAMGGLGFSSHAELPKMLADMHILVTFEGDNNVLLQQVSRTLFKAYTTFMQGKPIEFPSMSYLAKEGLEDKKFDCITSREQLKCPFTLQKILQTKAKKAVVRSVSFLSQRLGSVESQFDAWNDAVPFELDNAAVFYGELYIYHIALQSIMNCSEKTNQDFLFNLLLIFGLTKIKENFDYLCDNLTSTQVQMANEVLLELYEKIKYDAVLCFDGLMMDDEIVRSPFGSSTGKVYEEFLSNLLSERDNFGRSPHWKEIVKARMGLNFEI